MRRTVLGVGGCLAAAGLVVVSACGAPDSRAARAPEIPELRLDPDLRIDGNEADLVPITAVLVSPSGTIALVLWQDYLVRFFGGDGEELGSFGRQGEGPGEFMRLVRGGWVGDTLWISDTQLDRVTWITPELDLARTAPNPPGVRAPVGGDGPVRTYGQSFPYAMYPGDTALVSASGVIEGPPREPEEERPLLRVPVAGGSARQVASVPALIGGSIPVQYAEGMYANARVPFFPRPDWWIAPDGSRIATLVTDLSTPDSATFRVRVVDALGLQLFDRTFPFEAEPIPAIVMDSAIEANVGSREAGLRARMIDAIRGEAPTFYPEAERVRIGSDGRIWVSLRARAEGDPWLILDPTGEPQGKVTLPSNVTFQAADATHVYGTERDEFDVESVVRYRIVEPA